MFQNENKIHIHIRFVYFLFDELQISISMIFIFNEFWMNYCKIPWGNPLISNGKGISTFIRTEKLYFVSQGENDWLMYEVIIFPRSLSELLRLVSWFFRTINEYGLCYNLIWINNFIFTYFDISVKTSSL